jgi:hypothetical protein
MEQQRPAPSQAAASSPPALAVRQMPQAVLIATEELYQLSLQQQDQQDHDEQQEESESTQSIDVVSTIDANANTNTNADAEADDDDIFSSTLSSTLPAWYAATAPPTIEVVAPPTITDSDATHNATSSSPTATTTEAYHHQSTTIPTMQFRALGSLLGQQQQQQQQQHSTLVASISPTAQDYPPPQLHQPHTTAQREASSASASTVLSPDSSSTSQAFDDVSSESTSNPTSSTSLALQFEEHRYPMIQVAEFTPPRTTSILAPFMHDASAAFVASLSVIPNLVSLRKEVNQVTDVTRNAPITESELSTLLRTYRNQLIVQYQITCAIVVCR